MKDEHVFRLAKPVRKGLLRLVFSRFPLILALLAVQIWLLAAMFRQLEAYVPYITTLQSLFTLVMVMYLFNSGMDSSAKLTWMLILAAAPLPGAALLLFTRTNVGHRAVKARTARLIEDTKDAIPQEASVLRALAGDSDGTDDLARYLRRSGCFPIYDGTEATYLPSGEAAFEAMLRELEKAEKYIFLEFFIIEEGYMWGKVLELLTRKAARGVDVRVLYDGMCEVNHLPYHYDRLLAEKGVKAKVFTPIMPVVTSQYNYRDHRKILVADGNVAFTGGVNLSDEYINRVERFGHWKDAAVMLRGRAVKSFTLMFLQMWNLDEPRPVFLPWLAEGAAAEKPSGFVMPYADSPLDADKVGETVYMDILYRATDYVHIMTPYLILDGELETALKYAAERGVDVKLILPGIPDKKLAWALAKSHYASLTAAGVKIYEYSPGFVHAKVCVSDDEKAVVGTINLDYRSLYHHFECAAYLYRAHCVADAERDFLQTLSLCRAVTPETIAAEKPFYKIAGRLIKFLAPLL